MAKDSQNDSLSLAEWMTEIGHELIRIGWHVEATELVIKWNPDATGTKDAEDREVKMRLRRERRFARSTDERLAWRTALEPFGLVLRDSSDEDRVTGQIDARFHIADDRIVLSLSQKGP